MANYIHKELRYRYKILVDFDKKIVGSEYGDIIIVVQQIHKDKRILREGNGQYLYDKF